LPADGSAQGAQRPPKNRKTAALKGDARLIDPLQRLGASRPRTATAYGALRASPRIDHPDITARHPCRLIPPAGTDPTTQLAAQQPRFTPKSRGDPNFRDIDC
jgi:hypothetical protein